MEHFPLYLKLTGRRIALIGNSAGIIPKARLLAKTSAEIEIFAKVPCAELKAFMAEAGLADPHVGHQSHLLIHHERRFAPADLADPSRPKLAFAYLDTPSPHLVSLFEATHLPYCVIDDLARSQFTTPALIDRSPVTIAIGTEGTAPVLARRLKAAIEDRLPVSLAQVAAEAGRLRGRVASAFDRSGQRRFWGRFFDRLQYQGDDVPAQITAYAEAILREVDTSPASAQPPEVIIVGAGPGDPSMLTVRARDVLHEADIVLHDRLVSRDILDVCRREAEFLDVGKTAYRPSRSQTDINQLMIRTARRAAIEGKTVVRLKGGDPVVFARLDEETAALNQAGIACEIVPGISAAHAAAACMGVSLTRRGSRSQFRVLTGHEVDGFAAYDWRALASEVGSGKSSVAIYMGVRAAAFLSGQLLMHGLDGAVTVTIAEHVSRPDMRVVQGTLASLAADIKDHSIVGPAVIFLGLAPSQAVQRIGAPAGQEPPDVHKTQAVREDCYEAAIS